jgi:CubicO group peptidase (beta-lactamase class C family)
MRIQLFESLVLSRFGLYCTLICTLCCVPPQSRAQGTTAAVMAGERNGDLASYVEEARRTFDVPGIAVSVVADGHVVFEQGFGKRDLNAGDPVDAHTLFCIASNTKSFTATAMEILADQGKLHMDDRVTDHLPWFRMSDPYVTKEMRIRDLLAHRSGLGAHAGDLLFVPETTYTTREVVERLRYLPLKTGFRDSFAYENIMFAVATLVIEQVSGQTYAEFVNDHIFQPIGMSESRLDSTYLKAGENVAIAHMPRENGQLMAVPALAWKNSPGAAGIYASAHDMAKWVQLQLAGGKLPGTEGGAHRRLLSEAAQQRMWSMITPIDIDPPTIPGLQAAQPNFLGYAEGWYVSDYRGRRLIWHDGGFPGTVSRVTLLPDLRLGIVVLTNQESQEAYNAITLHVLDGYMGAPDTRWIEAYAEAARLKEAARVRADAIRMPARATEARPAHPWTSYLGVYHDQWYGDVDVRRVNGDLRVKFTKSPRLAGSLSPWSGDTLLVRWDDRTLDADALIDFAVDQKGRVTEAHMRRASSRTAHAYDYQDLDLIPVEHAGETMGARSRRP